MWTKAFFLVWFLKAAPSILACINHSLEVPAEMAWTGPPMHTEAEMEIGTGSYWGVFENLMMIWAMLVLMAIWRLYCSFPVYEASQSNPEGGVNSLLCTCGGRAFSERLPLTQDWYLELEGHGHPHSFLSLRSSELFQMSSLKLLLLFWAVAAITLNSEGVVVSCKLTWAVPVSLSHLYYRKRNDGMQCLGTRRVDCWQEQRGARAGLDLAV